MKREKCKNYVKCKSWQMYPTEGLCRNCYVKEHRKKDHNERYRK